MKTIAYLAVLVSMTANGQAQRNEPCTYIMNKCQQSKFIQPEDASRSFPLYTVSTCNADGAITQNKFLLECGNGKATKDNKFWYSSSGEIKPGCCQKDTVTFQPEHTKELKCKRSEEVIKITNAVLGKNCKPSLAKNTDEFRDTCKGQNQCFITHFTNFNKDLEVCDEAELELTYACYYDPENPQNPALTPISNGSGRRRLQRHHGGNNGGNNAGNSASFTAVTIDADCSGGQRVNIYNTCSNGLRKACHDQYGSCSYTITPQNSPECGSYAYGYWSCY